MRIVQSSVRIHEKPFSFVSCKSSDFCAGWWFQPTPLKNMRKRQLEWFFHSQFIWGKNMFQSPPSRWYIPTYIQINDHVPMVFLWFPMEINQWCVFSYGFPWSQSTFLTNPRLEGLMGLQWSSDEDGRLVCQWRFLNGKETSVPSCKPTSRWTKNHCYRINSL